DPGDRPRADGPAPGAAAGRAVAGPGAQDRRPGHGPDPPPARRDRPDRAAGRAERAQRARHRRPGGRAQPRQGGRRRGRNGPGRRRRSPPALPRVLASRRLPKVREFIQFTLGGISFGMVYAAIALSLVLIWRGTRILNYSQGAMAMLTTYIAFTVIGHTGN